MCKLHDRINCNLAQDLKKLLKDFDTNIGVFDVMRNLKPGKADGYMGLSSDCLVHGSRKLSLMLSLMCRIMIIHGYAPDVLLLGTMSPIPKGASTAHSSEKYRAITLISCILKLMDYLILKNQPRVFNTEDLQFGFKEKSSTTLCTGTFMEVTRYFASHNTDVHAVLLDATKAFDRVEYTLLFNRLLDRGMNSLYVRCLLFMYKNQRLRIKWNDVFSDDFPVTNGIKQGGVLSPLLFGVYIDVLIKKLRSSGFGCTIGPHYTGCIVYADDIVLLSPTKMGMEHMIKICQEYSDEYHVTFNSLKSQYIVFGQAGRVRHYQGILIGGNYISRQDSVIHLGHTIYADLNISDVDGVINTFYKQFNMFI
jgi:hypothetical protein